VTEQTTPDLGPLAAALAKAQAAFPRVTRDKTVTVTTKTGGSYSFKYAPLDSILEATRGPLAENGLTVVQLIDGHDLVTSLLHSSGAYLSGRAALPQSADIQGLGSAVTYMRRYAIQAMLGIAAEDDDDGNRSVGNTVVSADVERTNDGGLIGVAEAGDKQTSDFLLRQTPDGSELGFRLRGDKGGILVETYGPLADQLNEHRAKIAGQRVTVWGSIQPRTMTTGRDKRKVTYQALAATRVRVPDVGDFPVETAQPADPALTEAESEAIWDQLEAVGA
jgi:hypothetical protein